MIDVGLATLEAAKLDLTRGVRETSPNDGPAIREYLRPYGLQAPQNWCAVSVCHWMSEGCRDHSLTPPIAGSPAAQGVFAQLLHAGLAVRYGAPGFQRALRAGNIIVWRRPSRGSWAGHLGLVLRDYDGGGIIHTLEGNSGKYGDRVAEMKRPRTDSKIIGLGQLRDVQLTETDEEPVTLPSLRTDEIAWIEDAFKLSREEFLSLRDPHLE